MTLSFFSKDKDVFTEDCHRCGAPTLSSLENKRWLYWRLSGSKQPSVWNYLSNERTTEIDLWAAQAPDVKPLGLIIINPTFQSQGQFAAGPTVNKSKYAELHSSSCLAGLLKPSVLVENIKARCHLIAGVRKTLCRSFWSIQDADAPSV